MPQWSPVMKTGNTLARVREDASHNAPQWSPVMKTGNTRCAPPSGPSDPWPQWSPVMKTGNTPPPTADPKERHHASMEPGHEDREYKPEAVFTHEQLTGLNGARS